MTQNDNDESTLSTTPSMTSTSKTPDYMDLDSSFSIKEYHQRMSKFTEELNEVATSCFEQSKDDDNQSDPDAPGQEPAEDDDNNIDHSHLHITTTSAIDSSLHPPPTQTFVNNTLPLVNEEEGNHSTEENFCIATSDNQVDLIGESNGKPAFKYSLSLCIPCTDPQENVLKIESEISEISTEFTGIEKKSKDKYGHVMISYSHSTKAICFKIAQYLRDHNYNVWIDKDKISGNIYVSMASAIENASVILMAINDRYLESRYCQMEAEYAVENNKASIPMLMQAGYKPNGWLGLICGSKLHVDFSTLPFDEAFQLLVREIAATGASCGTEKKVDEVKTPASHLMTTTMSSLWPQVSDAHGWTADDVIQWLHREKLEIFEETLRYFNGKTLYQLNKTKDNCPAEFYRMIESSISPTTPGRLYYILTFVSALELLFSSSMR